MHLNFTLKTCADSTNSRREHTRAGPGHSMPSLGKTQVHASRGAVCNVGTQWPEEPREAPSRRSHLFRAGSTVLGVEKGSRGREVSGSGKSRQDPLCKRNEKPKRNSRIPIYPREEASFGFFLFWFKINQNPKEPIPSCPLLVPQRDWESCEMATSGMQQAALGRGPLN